MKEKKLCLKKEESIIVFNENCSMAIKINNGKNNKIIVSKVKNANAIENIKVFPVSSSDLKRYFLFEEYYQQMAGLDVSKKIKDKLEELMDYHLKFINISKDNDKDIENVSYQVIVILNN